MVIVEGLPLLQGEIIPYLGSYVERTHDIGKLRTLIGLLMLDVARYENGGEEAPLAAFRQLSGYGEMLAGLNELDDAALLRLLRENSFTRAVQEDQFAQRLAHTAAQALQGKYGADVREGFQELVRAMAHSSRKTAAVLRYSKRNSFHLFISVHCFLSLSASLRSRSSRSAAD